MLVDALPEQCLSFRPQGRMAQSCLGGAHTYTCAEQCTRQFLKFACYCNSDKQNIFLSLEKKKKNYVPHASTKIYLVNTAMVTPSKKWF